MDTAAITPPADTPRRRCRTCGVVQPWDTAHFRPLTHQLVPGLVLLAQRCLHCDAAAARGELLTSRERERARRLALAARLPVKRPSDPEMLRARSAAERVRTADRHRVLRAQGKQTADG